MTHTVKSLLASGIVLFSYLSHYVQGYKVSLSIVGCFREPYYDPLFPKVYLDYRRRIDWGKLPDMSHVIQACANEAVRKGYDYFAIKSYGLCSWGSRGLSVTRKGRKVSWCFHGLGGPGLVSVYTIVGSGKVNGGWSNWENWTKCSKSCGYGTQTRRRLCSNPPPSKGGAQCVGAGSSYRNCIITKCSPKVDGGWTNWSPWSTCSKTCGTGLITRSRTCTNPAPRNGGAACVGHKSQTQTCKRNACPGSGSWSQWGAWAQCSRTCSGGSQTRTRTCSSAASCSGQSAQTRACGSQMCPVNGTWSSWGTWGDCSQSCGTGSQTRRRTCTNPPPSNNGAGCQGSDSQNQVCNRNGCPVNGTWSSWGAWGDCSQSCGAGSQTRTRTCSNPPPSNGGAGCQGNGSQSQVCNRNGCPVNGSWSQWGTWGQCSQSCGGGSQTRTRTCTSPAPSNGGAGCQGDSSQSQICGAQGCPVNGSWSTWGVWGQCSRSCGEGSHIRRRTCTNPPPSNGGVTCGGSDSQSQVCNTNGCPVNGSWSQWGAWNDCSRTCSGGLQSRVRTCIDRTNNGTDCAGASAQTQQCNTNGCSVPVNGSWSNWGSWSSCSLTCGGGSRARTRTCTNPIPSGGGAACQGDSSQSQVCNNNGCPVNGSWSAWGAWSGCSRTCGGGSRGRMRTCSNPPPSNSGAACQGDSSQSQVCNSNACPVNGSWSSWGSWESCSQSCGGGSRGRMRTCTNPSPSNGGVGCQGDSSQSQVCNTNGCPVNGSWFGWGSWGSCSQTCGGGSRGRMRTCSNPAPSNGGASCVGDSSESQVCNTNGCPLNGSWSSWGSWESCSQTCGGGSRGRTRTCTNPPPSNGGVGCQGDTSESQVCNTNGCPVNGSWSGWGVWGSCSRTCGGGSQLRIRTCSNPPPSNNGAACQGSSTQSLSCNTNTCPGCQDGTTSLDQCGQRCTCFGGQFVNCTRIRKEFTSMTMAERARHVGVIKTASTDSPFKADYDRLINEHRELFLSGIHERDHFLTWHRYFILEYENLLRRVDCNFTVAYWDWSLVSSDPWSTANPRDLWHSGDTGFGGDGVGSTRCVQTGPFRESAWSRVPAPQFPGGPLASSCLTRQFNGMPPDFEAVTMVLDKAALSFNDFELMLRLNLHDVVHCLIDGTMCSLDSAAAPEFFLHHGFIDKLWDDWQKKSQAHKNAFFPALNEVMPGTQVFPREVIELSSQPGGVRVEYQSTRRAASLTPLLSSLSAAQIQALPRRRFTGLTEKPMKLFNPKPEEVKRAKEMEKMMQPLNDAGLS